MRERDSTMAHAPLDRGRSTVWLEDDMLLILHPQPAEVAFTLQQDFARARYGALCLGLSCTASICTKVAARKPPSPLLAIYATNYCGHTSGSVLCPTLTRQYLQDVMYTTYITCMNGQHRILMLFVTRHFRKILVSTFGLELYMNM